MNWNEVLSLLKWVGRDINRHNESRPDHLYTVPIAPQVVVRITRPDGTYEYGQIDEIEFNGQEVVIGTTVPLA